MSTEDKNQATQTGTEPNGSGAGGTTNDGSGDANSNSSTLGANPMTFDDFLASDKKFQAEFDRRVSQGIEKAVSKESSRLKSIYADQLDEQQKLNKMTDTERNEYLSAKREKELSDREAQITRRELSADAKNTLASKGLPVDLSDLLDYTSKETATQSLENVIASFNSAVENAVNTKLQGTPPPKDAGTGNEPDSKEKQAENDFNKGLKMGW